MTARSQPSAEPGRARRHIRETLMAYFLIFPATFVTVVFGVYPVVSGLWESLKAGRPITNQYVGLDQYIRSIGSLVYVAIVLLVVVFLYQAYLTWERLRKHHSDSPTDPLWWFLIPGFVTALGTFMLMHLSITKGYTYEILSGVSIMWPVVVIIIVGAILYYVVSQRTIGNKAPYIVNTWLMMLLMILAILLVHYSYLEMKGDVEDARQIAAQVLTTDVGNATPLRSIDQVQYADIELAEAVPVQAKIGDEVYETTLAPSAYQQIGVDQLNGATFSLSNNQRVQVLIPLTRGFGFEPSVYQTEASLVLERSAGQIGGGAATLEVPVVLDDSDIIAPYDIYVTGQVGVAVIARSAYTVPVEHPFLATIAVAILLGMIYMIGYLRQSISADEVRVQLFERLGLVRVIAWLGVFGLVIYISSQVLLYRDTAIAMQKLNLDQFRIAYEYINGTPPAGTLTPDRVAQQLMFFPQVVSIAAGALLIAMAYIIWNEAAKKDTTKAMSGNILFAILLMVGGWLCISELPSTIMMAGTDAIAARDALLRTALYSLGTVPAQLAIGMLLAYLMFYEVTTGKSIFRLIYFMPYITPQVATATVFTVIFSLRPEGLANQFLDLIGVAPQLWVQEGDGVIRIIYQEVFKGDPSHVPAFFQGPSLALATVILFNIWVYTGYNAVIFLAGFGSIPGELYEAARVDGAGRWAAFRHITFPLLSPVTFFLSMLSIIGTFKAFSSVYVLREGNNNYADTLTVQIFVTLFRDNNRGYAASLAFVLFGVIMILTLVQNRLSKDRVFYG